MCWKVQLWAARLPSREHPLATSARGSEQCDWRGLSQAAYREGRGVPGKGSSHCAQGEVGAAVGGIHAGLADRAYALHASNPQRHATLMRGPGLATGATVQGSQGLSRAVPDCRQCWGSGLGHGPGGWAGMGRTWTWSCAREAPPKECPQLTIVASCRSSPLHPTAHGMPIGMPKRMPHFHTPFPCPMSMPISTPTCMPRCAPMSMGMGP